MRNRNFKRKGTDDFLSVVKQGIIETKELYIESINYV